MKSIYFLCLSAALGILGFISRASADYTIFHGDRTLQRVAITVDDCYNDDRIREMLDLCEQYEIPMTFFVVGNALRQEDRALWQRALDLGCEIGNHTFSHVRLPGLSREAIAKTLKKTQTRLDEVLGYPYTMQLMRPPYGSLSLSTRRISDSWVADAIEDAGYLHAVRWDVDETDPTKAIRDVQNGSILLYHAKFRDVRCLQRLIPDLISQDYVCLTVSELLNLQPPAAAPPNF